MFHHDDGLTGIDQVVENPDQTRDVGEMEPCRRLVEEKEPAGRIHTREESGEAEPLGFPARQGRGRLTECEISQADAGERPESIADPRPLRKELPRFVDGHRENLVHVPTAVADLENVWFEARTITALAGHLEIGHEMHLDGHGAHAFALFAPTGRGIERKMSGRDSRSLCRRGRCEQSANIVVGLQVGRRVRATRPTGGSLTHQDDLVVVIEARESIAGSGLHTFALIAQPPIVEDLLDQGRLTRARDSGDADQSLVRNRNRHIPQIVLPGAFDGHPRAAPAAMG